MGDRQILINELIWAKLGLFLCQWALTETCHCPYPEIHMAQHGEGERIGSAWGSQDVEKSCSALRSPQWKGSRTHLNLQGPGSAPQERHHDAQTSPASTSHPPASCRAWSRPLARQRWCCCRETPPASPAGATPAAVGKDSQDGPSEVQAHTSGIKPGHQSHPHPDISIGLCFTALILSSLANFVEMLLFSRQNVK